jgi:hypothetical protein
MTTDERLRHLSSPTYIGSEPGRIAAELYEVRAALRMVERDIRSIQSMGGIITELSPSTRNAIVAALKGPEARGGTAKAHIVFKAEREVKVCRTALARAISSLDVARKIAPSQSDGDEKHGG